MLMKGSKSKAGARGITASQVDGGEEAMFSGYESLRWCEAHGRLNRGMARAIDRFGKSTTVDRRDGSSEPAVREGTGKAGSA